jgi:hypothetical protein
VCNRDLNLQLRRKSTNSPHGISTKEEEDPEYDGGSGVKEGTLEHKRLDWNTLSSAKKA